ARRHDANLWASVRQAGSLGRRRRSGAGGRKRDDRFDPEGSNGSSGGECFGRGDVSVERLDQVTRVTRVQNVVGGSLWGRHFPVRSSRRAPPPSGLMISLGRWVR